MSTTVQAQMASDLPFSIPIFQEEMPIQLNGLQTNQLGKKNRS
jgi:hypothetical protein